MEQNSFISPDEFPLEPFIIMATIYSFPPLMTWPLVYKGN